MVRGGCTRPVQKAFEIPILTSPSASERFAFAQGAITVGQKARAIAREALEGLLRFAASLLARGHKCEQILEMLMPV